MQALDQTTLPKQKNTAKAAAARTPPMPLDSMHVGSLGSTFCRDADPRETPLHRGVGNTLSRL